MEMQNTVINLNPKYMMTLYDIDLMKKTIENMDIKEILKNCPIQTLSKNTLLYHASRSDDYKSLLGKSPENKDNDFNEYYFNFLNHYQEIMKDRQSVCEVLWNNEELKLLDLTRITVELGFNPIMNNFNEVSMKLLNTYCKKNKIDGIVSFDITYATSDNIQENESNYHYIKDNTAIPISPIVYITYDGGNKLKNLGAIQLKNKREYLTKKEINKLHNILFCNIQKIITYGQKINATMNIIINNYSYQIEIIDNKKKENIDLIFDIKKKYLLDLLVLNNSNLTEECDFIFPSNKLMDELTSLSEIKNVEITYNVELDDDFNDNVFNILLTNIAINNDINPFIYVNYDKLDNIDYLKIYTYDLINSYYHTMEDIKRLILNVEKLIITKLNFFDKNSTVNFVNLEYIPDSYNYIKNKILNELNDLPLEEALLIIEGIEKNKNVNKYFDTYQLYHSIIYKKYDKPKKLYQSLLNDLTNYKNLPNIDLKWLKLLSKLSDVESQKQYTDFIKNIKLNIYDVYKEYIKGKLMFYELYNFLGIDALHNYMVNFSQLNNLNTNIILYYNIITKDNKYSITNLIKELKKTDLTDIEFLQQWFEKIKMYIIVSKFYEYIINYYNLNKTDNVDEFINNAIEELINIDLDSNNSYIKYLLTGNINWIDPIFNFKILIQLFESEYNNEKMLNKIYDLLNITLNNKNLNKVLLLTNNKNLLRIYLQYLNNDISKNDLSNAVFSSIVDDYKESKKKISDNEDSDNESKKKSKKSKKKKDEGTESM